MKTRRKLDEKKDKVMNVNDKQMPIEYDNLLRDFQDLRKEKDKLYEEILEKERVICNKFCYECELERRIKELEASLPKWVSFKSKVPTMYQNILVNVPGANKENRMEPTRSIFWCPAREYDLKLGILYYTHWMPAPPPPKEEK